jgi:hypothetical protein
MKRCLLDKGVARRILEGLLKRMEGRSLDEREILALSLFQQVFNGEVKLFIVPASFNTIQNHRRLPRYQALIKFFLDNVEVATATNYFTRWSRRLRDYNFTREDSAVLALGTFGRGINEHDNIGMDYVITFDQPMINNWQVHQADIENRLATMCHDLPEPYNLATVPLVLRSLEG